MFAEIAIAILGLVLFLGGFIVLSEKRKIMKGGVKLRGSVVGYASEKAGRQYYTKTVIGFSHNGNHYELSNVLPTPVFRKKIGKKVVIYFNEEHPESIVVKGSYWTEIYAMLCSVVGLLILTVIIWGFLAG